MSVGIWKLPRRRVSSSVLYRFPDPFAKCGSVSSWSEFGCGPICVKVRSNVAYYTFITAEFTPLRLFRPAVRICLLFWSRLSIFGRTSAHRQYSSREEFTSVRYSFFLSANTYSVLSRQGQVCSVPFFNPVRSDPFSRSYVSCRIACRSPHLGQPRSPHATSSGVFSSSCTQVRLLV